MNNKKCNKSRRKPILPKIDNKAPHFDASTYLKPFELQQHIMRVRKIDQENLDLLRKMNVIHRLGVSTVLYQRLTRIDEIRHKIRTVYIV